jgi:hypothetical protein
MKWKPSVGFSGHWQRHMGGATLNKLNRGKKLRDFYCPQRVQHSAMDAFLNFMMSDTSIFGFDMYNWILALAGFTVIWGIILVKDL